MRAKRNLVQLCLLGALLLLLPATVQAQFTYTTNNGAVTITGYTSSNDVVMIPDTIDNLPVRSIGDWAFYAKDVTNVFMPDSVTSIGDGAFFDCVSLTNVSIGSGVASIGDWAFGFCTSLVSINCRGNAPSLAGNNVFYGNAATIYYLSGTTGWGPTFDGHPSILWNPPMLFTYTTNSDGTTLTITGCTGSNSAVIIPDAINFLPVSSIGENAFFYDVSLTNVMIPDSITSIGIGAFEICPNLTDVMIPNSVTNIEYNAFVGCDSLMKITVGAGNSFFSSVDGVLFDHNQTVLIQYPGGKVGGYTIPNSVVSIGLNAFNGCSGLSSIEIPNSVTNIEIEAFAYCTDLTNITIPSSVISIGSSMFLGCTNLVNITFLNSIATLGYEMFAGCTNLRGLYFWGNAPPNVGNYAFFGDDNVTVYYLPGAIGWQNFATQTGVPVILWNPQVQTDGGSFGVGANGFSFNIAGTTNIPIVVEAASNLAGPWTVAQSCTLTNGKIYFSDPQWTNYPSRFYRIRSP